MKYLPLLLLFLLCACAPIPDAQAQAPASKSADDGVNLAVAQAKATAAVAAAQMTSAAQVKQEQRDAAATVNALEARRIAAEREAAQAVASQEAARLALQATAQQATFQAGATADSLSVLSTRSAISATATASALQFEALYVQATATADSYKATALQAGVDATLIPDRVGATAIALRTGPTITAQAVARQQARMDNAWSTLSGFCGFGLLLICGVIAWGAGRILATVNRAAEYRAALPPTVSISQAAAIAETEPAGILEPPAPPPPDPNAEARKFVIDCARVSGWSAKQIPSDDKFRERNITDWSSGSKWQPMINHLAGRGLIVKTGTGTAPWVVANEGTYRELYAALIPSPAPSGGEAE